MREKLDERNAKILERVASGETMASVARSYAISKQRVEAIVRSEKYEARVAVSRALSVGQLVRPEQCDACSKQGPVEAHHDDYSQVLQVRWLCSGCHGRTRKIPSARKGILCPECEGSSGQVLDSRKRSGGVYRRRECTHCGHRFTTHEVVARRARISVA